MLTDLNRDTLLGEWKDENEVENRLMFLSMRDEFTCSNMDLLRLLSPYENPFSITPPSEPLGVWDKELCYRALEKDVSLYCRTFNCKNTSEMMMLVDLIHIFTQHITYLHVYDDFDGHIDELIKVLPPKHKARLSKLKSAEGHNILGFMIDRNLHYDPDYMDVVVQDILILLRIKSPRRFS